MIKNGKITWYEKTVNVCLYVISVLLAIEIFLTVLIIVYCQNGIIEKEQWLQRAIARRNTQKLIEINSNGRLHYIFTIRDVKTGDDQ